MERRELFQILAATTVAAQAEAQHGAHSAFDPKTQRPRFFTRAEYDQLDVLCETILPADLESGGARDACVRYFLDRIALYSDSASKQQWKSGLAAVESEAKTRFGRGIRALDQKQIDELFGLLLINEVTPQTPAERFAVRLKLATIEAYGMSPVGMKHLGYKGNRAVKEFPGCVHPEHKTPPEA
jgi:hypothetical protein